ncbi:motility protein A [Halobacteriovorax sp. GFR7]|uniref:motility protein A n=1 Tax=unclassified Halobacteriovorax TaxID=2639665 RepID=UPI003D9644C0
MNIFSLIGLIISAGVLFAGLRMSSSNLGLFVDGPSLFIVIGGTFAATSVAFQLNKIGALFKIFLKQFLGGKMVNSTEVIKEIMQICEAYRSGEAAENLPGKANDEFLKEGLELIADGFLQKEKIIEILEQRAVNMHAIRSEDTRKIKTLGKFPPAFGMMGTTIGMIVLLANLGGADAMKMIGPAMGVCLITTLYGVIIANLGFIPIAENLEDIQIQMETKDNIIIEGIKHILDKSNPVLVAEELNSFLLPSERLDWKSAS